jgi:hypothetical protein
MKIIGISGKMGSGKDYITTNVIIPMLEKHNKKYLQISFADQIKINVLTNNENVNYNNVFEEKTLESRLLLQYEGQVQRENDKDIWIKYLSNWVNVFNKRNNIQYFITPDVRHMNEYNFIKNNDGIIVKIIAPNRNNIRLLKESKGDLKSMDKIKTHISECELDHLSDDFYSLIISNDKDLNENDLIELQFQFEQLILN